MVPPSASSLRTSVTTERNNGGEQFALADSRIFTAAGGDMMLVNQDVMFQAVQGRVELGQDDGVYLTKEAISHNNNYHDYDIENDENNPNNSNELDDDNADPQRDNDGGAGRPILSYAWTPRSWLKVFKDCTIDAQVLEIDEDFIQFLLEDKVMTGTHGMISNNDGEAEDDDSENADEDTDSDGEIETDRAKLTEGDERTEFRDSEMFETRKRISDALRKLGGHVHPKIGPVAPTDATWVNFNRTTKCSSVDDILTLLKCSDRVLKYIDCMRSFRQGKLEQQHENDEQLDQQELLQSSEWLPRKPLYLSLHKWSNLNHSMEFRCFVYDAKLVAISQRHIGGHYEFLKQKKTDILNVIQEFYHGYIVTEISNKNFVFDSYIDRRDTVWIIDMAGFEDPMVDPLLFSWQELKHLARLQSQDLQNHEQEGQNGEEEDQKNVDGQVWFRCVGASSTIVPATSMSQGIPVELQGQVGLDAVIQAAMSFER